MRHVLLAAAFVAVSASAVADSEVRNGSDFIRVTAKPCKDEKVIEHLTAAGENALDYRAAVAELGGQLFSACWRPIFEKRVVFIRYSDGDAGAVPFEMLQPVKEV